MSRAEIARREGLALVRAETERVLDLLGALERESWSRPTNCAPWDVRMMAAHLVRGAESFIASLERGLQGNLEPAMTPEQRVERTNQIAAQSQQQILKQLREASGRFEELLAGMTPEQLALPATHVHGLRDAVWFVQQRLAELMFHLWDLRVSLDLHPELDEGVVRWLLPMLVERNLPVLYDPNSRLEGTIGLAVQDVAELAWTLRPGADRVEVIAGSADTAAAIEGDATSLALLVYGRLSLDELERRGRLRVRGDRALAGRFGAAFRGP